MSVFAETKHLPFQMVKRILRYLKGTIRMGHLIQGDSSLESTAYSDSDWAGCKQTRKSTTGFCAMLGNNVISWSAKKQTTMLLSIELWQPRLQKSLGLLICCKIFVECLLSVPILFCDNMSALQLSVNPVFHARTKHIEMKHHCVREQGALKKLETR